ncbi:MAG: VWA domain-containing protein, partial [Lautropia sp.]
MSFVPAPSSTDRPRTGRADAGTAVAAASAAGARRHHVADNVLHFTRVLRAAGLPVGTDRALLALDALDRVGFARRDDVHAALASVMIDRREQQPIFDAAFAAFWRDPKLLERLMYLVLPKVTGRGRQEQAADRSARLQEALQPRPAQAPREQPATADDEVQFDASLTWSDRERLQQADFATMTAAEFSEAKRLAATLALPLRPVVTRRQAPAPRGRIDLRRTLRDSLRTPDMPVPRRAAPRRRPPPVVILLDISGSMEHYTRIFLHFAHALGQRQPVQTLVFGTRLTQITRCLRSRDPDDALA